MKHMFDHPECGRGSIDYRQDLPLRESEVKRPDNKVKSPEALGIHLVEVLSVMWVIGYGMAFFALISVFGITWWICKGDISGGFTAAGFFGLGLSLLGGSVALVMSSRE